MTRISVHDKPLPEDASIDAAHPTLTGRHDLYAEAMRLVGAKHSKATLVALVNWLLLSREVTRVRAIRDCADYCTRRAQDYRSQSTGTGRRQIKANECATLAEVFSRAADGSPSHDLLRPLA